LGKKELDQECKEAEKKELDQEEVMEKSPVVREIVM
jgi:hypothetical protein